MGLVWSGNTPALPSTSLSVEEQQEIVEIGNVDDEQLQRKHEKQEELMKFKEELQKRREARRNALSALNKRMTDLRQENELEREENKRLNKEVDEVKRNECETNRRLQELIEELKRVQIENETLRKQLENSDLKRNLTEEKLEIVKTEEVEGLERQVKALKDVAAISAEMLRIRELQVNELKDKLTAIEETGQAYEKEVDNMRRLRALYEERARAVLLSHQMELDREKARLVASEAKLELAEQRALSLERRNAELKESLKTMDTAIDEAKAENSELRLELAGKREELYNTTSQMSIINQLFSQVLSGPDGLERVTRVLEEHHDLVNHLTAKGQINDLASTLLELADQSHIPTEEEQDIAANLSKVWRLLVELLGHHAKPVPGDTSPNSCYKSVDTPKGPKLVISVSQTFLRLKDLILEKNSLVKEVGRLKELNTTLESRLGEQESRLAVVAAELHKTWEVVNKLKTQHKHLHTHEKVLRYELAQKRLMLNELKKELEDCRESWELARAKNSQTEEDWRELRREFASRKQASNAESGYEESPGDSQDEEEWSTREEPDTEAEVSREDADEVSREDADEVSEEIKDGTEVEEIKEDSATASSAVVETVNQVEENLVAENGEGKEEVIESKQIENGVTLPSTSSPTPASAEEIAPKQQRTAEEILKAREDRLQRLEEQCKGLFNRMNQTSQRSDKLSNRLVELHEHYGEEGRQGRRQRQDESLGCEEASSYTNSTTTADLNDLTPSESNESKPQQRPDLVPDAKT